VTPPAPRPHARHGRHPAASMLTALLITGGALPAQDPTSRVEMRPLIGVVQRVDGAALADVEVEGAGQRVRTDAEGRFRLRTSRRDTLTLLLRRLGYEPIAVTLRADHLRGDTIVVRMEETPLALEAVRVREADLRSPLGLGGFEERRARGLGTFVTREEIDRRQTNRLSDVLRGRRGLTLVRTPTGGYGVRFGVASGRQRRCIPDLWIDGQRARGMELDDIPASTIVGIELYATIATVPFQFSASGAGAERCGTVVLWSRPPG
jgi:hypothetical protein